MAAAAAFLGSHLPNASTDKISGHYFNHSNAHRINTDAFMYDVIKRSHPGLTVTNVPEINANLLAYAAANPASASTKPLTNDSIPTPNTTKSKPPAQWPADLKWTLYVPPARRLDGPVGNIGERLFFSSFLFYWHSHEFLVYLVDGRDGDSFYPAVRNQYIVSSPSDTATASQEQATTNNDESADPVYTMIREVGQYTSSLHDEIWVYNDGFWQKDGELYQAILKSKWENVILPESLKKEVREVAERFFAKGTRRTYHRLGVPWKRGVIFYGPPGNGKTISIKATMHTLYSLPDPVPTLYVKSLSSFAGPEYSINQIFIKARATAPCYLVFEDLDSLVTPAVRSFFLNAVDGISENEGILMVGSTNHLSQLDDGISKRPSRFDRKYEFGLPGRELRRLYAVFWQGKLRGRRGDGEVDGGAGAGDGEKEHGHEHGHEDEDGGDEDITIDFPDILLDKIAGITDGFSFAYMQEAFVSTLLVIAGEREGRTGISRESGRSSLDQDTGDEVDSVSEAFELVGLDADGEGNRDHGDDQHGGGSGGGDGHDKDPLDKFILWKEMKVQVALLKKEIGKDGAKDRGR